MVSSLTFFSLRAARALAALALVFVISAMARPSQAAEAPIVIRFSHVVDESTPKGIGARLFKERAEAKFPGRLRVDVFPRALKFTDEEVLVAMVLGDIEMAAPSFTQFRSFNRSLQVFELPFLFRDVGHLHRFQNGLIGRQLLDFMLPQGIHGLAYWDSGMRVISANKPLVVPEDAAGLLFRTEPSAVFQEQYKRIGVTTLPLPFRLVPDAIRDGFVNGQENSWSNIYSRNIQKLQRRFTELNHSFLGYLVVANAGFWAGLPADIRSGLEDILAQVSAEVNEIARKQAGEDRAKVAAEEGVEILTPTNEQLDRWKDAFIPVWGEFTPQIGKEVMDAAVEAAR